MHKVVLRPKMNGYNCMKLCLFALKTGCLANICLNKCLADSFIEMGRKIIKDDIKFNFCRLIKQKTRTLQNKNTSYDHVASEHVFEKYCKRIHFIP